MDRSMLESEPLMAIEGMIIMGFVIGAQQGYVYCRAEKPLAAKKIGTAIEVARQHGLLGENILGTDFSFNIDLRLGAGAFVCGEETAMLESIEGKRGMPRIKPPYPATYGLFGKPTVINNVENHLCIIENFEHGSRCLCYNRNRKIQGHQGFCGYRQNKKSRFNRSSNRNYLPPNY